MLDALRIAKVDLYGDSYGTYAAQAFAARHGDRLRSIVLDGAYPVPGTDPALGDLAEATQRALRVVCEQMSGCDEDPIAVLQRLRDRLRARPLTARGLNTEGERVRVRLDEASLAALIQSGYVNFPMYRDIYGAARSFEAGDRAPLLRLFAENKLDTTASPVRGFSEALYLAVSCHDYPQLWDPAAPFAARRDAVPARHRAAAPGALRPDLTRRVDVARLRGRAGLPALAGAARRPATRAAGRDLPRRADARAQRRARQHHDHAPGARGRGALPARDVRGDPEHRAHLRDRRPRQLRGAARARVHPPAEAVRRELRDADRRAACARALPAHGGGDEPRGGEGGQPRSEPARRIAAAAVLTAGDAIQRWVINSGGASRGLRGGRWSYTGDKVVRFRFRRARFVRDVAVSGTATWRLTDGAVLARLRLPGRGRLRARWSTQRLLGTATVAGTLRGRRLRAVTGAP